MAQQNIDFGTFPDDPSADPIRTAFQQVQQNFTEVYSGLAATSVTSINRTVGAGITVNSPTGNVVVSANIASIQVSSATLKVGTTPNPVTSSTTYRNYTQTLYVELPSTLTISNLTTTGNITVSGNLTSNDANLGNAATANYFIGSGNNLSNIQGANVSGLVANATYSTSTALANTVAFAAQPNITSTGTLVSLSVSGNANVGNIGANNGVFTSVSGNGSSLTDITGANITGTVSNANNASYLGGIAASSYLETTGTGSSLTAITGANVTGEVAYAGIANSVTAANVSGLGNIATINIDGNEGNILYGNGVFAPAGGADGYGNSDVAIFLASYGSNTITTTGNVSVGNIIGNGYALTSINGANVSSAVTNAETVTASAQPNVTSLGTLLNVSITGNAIIDDSVFVANVKAINFYSNRSAIPIGTDTIVDTFPSDYYRSAKYTMRAGDGTDYQALEVLLVHNDSTSIITVYGSISTAVGNADLVTFTSDISAGNVNVYATAVGPNTDLNLMGTYVPD